MTLVFIIAGISTVTGVVVGLLWHRITFARQMDRYKAQWAIVRKQSQSKDPIERRAAAKQALRLIQRGPS